MKRQDILDKFDDELHEDVNDVVNHFESKFQEIRDLLDGFSFDNLDKIEDARNLADNLAGELY